MAAGASTSTRDTLQQPSSFPVPITEETIHGIASRFQFYYSNITSETAAARFLFNTQSEHINGALPYGLSHFVSLLPPTFGLDIKSTLTLHTAYPFLKLFFPPNRSRSIGLMLLGGSDVSPLTLGVVAKGRAGNIPAKMCIECVNEDIIKYGVAVWYRCHQIPGVRVCPKHVTPLIDRCPSCGPRNWLCNRQYIFYLPVLRCTCGVDFNDYSNSLREAGIVTGEARDYAQFADSLLHGDLPDNFAEYRLDFLRSVARESGIYTGETCIPKRLSAELGERFSDTFLSEFGYGSREDLMTNHGRRSALHGVLYQGQESRGPGAYMVMLMLLFDNYETLKHCWNEYMDKYKSKDDVCLKRREANDSHHLDSALLVDFVSKPVLTKYILRAKPEAVRALQLALSLMRVYSRDYPKKPTYTKSNGVRNTKMVSVIRQNISNSACSICNNSLNKLDRPTQLWLLRFENRLQKHKHAIVDFKRRHPFVTRVELVDKYYTGCCFLRILEPHWYTTNVACLPSRERRKRPPTLDWSLRDIEACSAITSALKRLLNRERRPVRLTKTLLLRESGMGSKICCLSDKLPDTRGLLSKIVETPDDYCRRKLRWAFAELIRQDKAITRSRLRELAIVQSYERYLIEEFLESHTI